MATILVCTQEHAPRRRLVRALEQKGHDVAETDNGGQAWEMVRSSPPDLLLIDLVMENPGGYQFVRRLSHEADLKPPRVMFLAAPHMESEARLLARTCGGSPGVADVSDTEALLTGIDAALSAPPPPREPDTDEDDTSALYPIVTRLFQRVTELQSFNLRLGRHAAMGAAQLQVARSALKREVIKRLRAEQAMLLENQRLRLQSMRDPLTGLYNRRYLEESLAREQSRAMRCGKPLGIMVASIDGLKRCNERYGHAVGDVVLRTVAQCLASLARTEDIVCRYGGGEFVLVMTGTSTGMLRQRADALGLKVPKLYIEHDRGRIPPVTLSIGLASFPDDGDTALAALGAAETALDRIRMAGHNRIAAAKELRELRC